MSLNIRVDEARALSDELALQIMEQIQTFERRTTLRVVDVQLDRVSISTYESVRDEDILVRVNVSVQT